MTIESTNHFPLPNEICYHLFSYLSARRVFLILPTLSKKFKELVEKYDGLYKQQEKQFEERCLELHLAWKGRESIVQEKDRMISWRKFYLLSQPSFYETYLHKISDIQIGKDKAYIKKIRRRVKNFHVLEKLIVNLVGEEIFKKIPLIDKCLKEKEMEIDNRFVETYYQAYCDDLTMPSAVQGIDAKKNAFLFMRVQIYDKVSKHFKNKYISFGLFHQVGLYPGKWVYREAMKSNATDFSDDFRTMIIDETRIKVIQQLFQKGYTLLNKSELFFNRPG